jgi:hypothetical protein
MELVLELSLWLRLLLLWWRVLGLYERLGLNIALLLEQVPFSVLRRLRLGLRLRLELG